ncbi:MAG: cytochrome C oxidase subunit IV family protein [Acidobacteria bacterium]|nr:cytochrome C oxidase subunit IV family protein [Acidobacteriota bacterium]
MQKAEAHPVKQIYLWIWVWLLTLTVVEVFLAYRHLAVMTMLVILMGLSVIKAALIMSYFMHLRYERFSLALTLIPMLIICIALLASFFPDSLRLLELRPR